MTEPRPEAHGPHAVACLAPAVVCTETDTCPGVCESLSLEDAYVVCDEPPAGDEVSVVLCLPSLGPVEIGGRIHTRGPHGIAVHFTRLATTALLALCTFIGSAPTSF